MQPRETSTGRWSETTHSAPEVALLVDPLAAWSPLTRQRILKALANISESFDDVHVVATQGVESFYAPDHLVRNAAVGSLVRLGEQARRLPKDFVQLQSDIDYFELVGMRNVLAHQFRTVSWEIVWTAVNDSGRIYAPRHARVRASYDRSFAPRGSG